jgi:hypothetical protein
MILQQFGPFFSAGADCHDSDRSEPPVLNTPQIAIIGD